MLEPSVETARLALSNTELEQIKTLVKQVRNTKHFRQILQSAKPALRRQVYELIAPLLGFEAPPFDIMMKAQLKRERHGKKKGQS